MSRHSGARAPIYLCAFLFSFAVSSPAFADHVGPSGVGGSSASLQVIGPDTLQAGKSAAGFRIVYLRPDRRSDAQLEALAADHIHAHNSDYNINAAAGFAYGITNRLTVSAELPYVRRSHLREGEHSHDGGVATNEVVKLGTVSGIGDLSLLAKYRLTGDEGIKFALIGGLKAPTGSTHKQSLEGERLETEHQPGSGSWDPLAGASIGAELGPVALTSSLLYQFARPGAQHTRLGDRAVGGIALSHHFGPAEHHHHDDDDHDLHDAPHGHAAWDIFIEAAGEWEGRQKVAGEIEEDSGGKAIWLSPGARFTSPSGFSVSGAIGLPIWQRIRPSHPDNDFRLTLAVGKAF